jgi:hypothetical protein
MKMYGRVDVYILAFLTAALDGCEMSGSRPCRFIPGETIPTTHCVRGLDVPQSRLRRYGEEKNVFPLSVSEPLLLGRPTRGLVAVPTELSHSSYNFNEVMTLTL